MRVAFDVLKVFEECLSVATQWRRIGWFRGADQPKQQGPQFLGLEDALIPVTALPLLCEGPVGDAQLFEVSIGEASAFAVVWARTVGCAAAVRGSTAGNGFDTRMHGIHETYIEADSSRFGIGLRERRLPGQRYKLEARRWQVSCSTMAVSHRVSGRLKEWVRLTALTSGPPPRKFQQTSVAGTRPRRSRGAGRASRGHSRRARCGG